MTASMIDSFWVGGVKYKLYYDDEKDLWKIRIKSREVLFQGPKDGAIDFFKTKGIAITNTVLGEPRPTPRKKRKKKTDNHRYTYVVKWGTFTQIRDESMRIGCSINSLLDMMVDKYFNPPLIQTRSGYIADSIERPPVIGLSPSRKKPKDKDPLLIEIESHPLFKRQKERYG